MIGVGLLLATPAQAVDQIAINKAIDKGVAYLKAVHVDSSWGRLGATALCGLTLLECDVSEDDPIIVKAADRVRKESITDSETYDLACSVLFLDRLGRPGDEPLIDSLTVRLMAGQNSAGGWSYKCPDNSPEEKRRLVAEIERGATLSTHPDRKPGAKRKLTDFAPALQVQLERAIQIGGASALQGGDNSNTQFANLALWVGRRHGVPVDACLERINLRCRNYQRPDGGWSYVNPQTPPARLTGPGVATGLGSAGSTASMTCAGILGLMTNHGVLADQKGHRGKVWAIGDDANLKFALTALADVVGVPAARDEDVPKVGGKTYYFLWSLERICVGMDLTTLGKKDWYAWGAQILTVNQAADGSWHGEFAGHRSDTCFALLFLKRANLVRDLTAGIKGRTKDVIERTLSSTPGGGGPKKLVPGAIEPADGKGGDTTDVKKPDNPVTRPSDPPKPRPEASSAAGRLATDLVKATGIDQEAALNRLRDGKGVEYTEALATAITQLDGERKDLARAALAKRLTRMKPDFLQRYLQDPEGEIRRAAATACATRELKTHVEHIIPLLRDPVADVRPAAHAALKALTGQDLPADAATWEDWLKKQK
jgi:hypothetical protein